MVAAQQNRIEIMKLLLQRGAELNTKNIMGDTALILAARENHRDAVRLLIESGAEPNILNYEDMGALEVTMDDWIDGFIRSRCGQEEPKMFIEEIESQETPQTFTSSPDSRNNETIHHFEKNLNDFCSKKLEKGEKKLDFFFSEVHYGSLERINMLLKRGLASVNSRDSEGNTPLMIAASNGRIPLMNLLLSRGAWVNAQNDLGYTPLMLAAMEGHQEAVKLLLSWGADEDLCNYENMRALECSRDQGIDDMLLHFSENMAAKEKQKKKAKHTSH